MVWNFYDFFFWLIRIIHSVSGVFSVNEGCGNCLTGEWVLDLSERFALG